MATPDEKRLEASLRPRNFEQYVGQSTVVEKLKVYVAAAKARGDALDHCLFSGPPGLGKTSLAHILAAELGVGLHVTSGPALERKGDLTGLLINLGARDFLFIDEIHRLPAQVEEYLYPAMEDFRLDITIDSGPAARAMKIDLPPFTLVGATTRTGLLTSPWKQMTNDANVGAAARRLAAEVRALQAEDDGLDAVVIGLPRRLYGCPDQPHAPIASKGQVGGVVADDA